MLTSFLFEQPKATGNPVYDDYLFKVWNQAVVLHERAIKIDNASRAYINRDCEMQAKLLECKNEIEILRQSLKDSQDTCVHLMKDLGIKADTITGLLEYIKNQKRSLPQRLCDWWRGLA